MSGAERGSAAPADPQPHAELSDHPPHRSMPPYSPALAASTATPAVPQADPARHAPLEHTLTAVEFRLTALGEALRLLDARAIDSHASELHRALAQAIDRFSDAAREGPVALGLRQRLALASGRVAAQRNALAQATAALDRAIDTLLPDQPQPSEHEATGPCGG